MIVKYYREALSGVHQKIPKPLFKIRHYVVFYILATLLLPIGLVLIGLELIYKGILFVVHQVKGGKNQ